MSATVDHSDADEAPSKNDDTATGAADGSEAADGTSKVERLRAYLTVEAKRQGELYFKSKFIADDVGLSPKEIGALMVELQDSASALEIEKWSYTNATTWRIAPQDPA